MSYRDAIRNAEKVPELANERTKASLGVAVSYIGGRCQAIREKGGGPLLDQQLGEIETLCRALLGEED